ncbi:MAG: phosphotransferase [Actinomycetota bacterium]
MTSPVPDLDYTATVRRPDWATLPDAVQAAIGEAAGCAVVRADPPPGSGFTGSFAAVVHLRDGRRVFAKAGRGSDDNPHVLRALTQEAGVLAALPSGTPSPRLVGARRVEDGEHPWQVVVIEAVEGRLPQPWTEGDVDAVHRACLQAAAALTPPPAGLGLSTLPADLRQDTRTLGLFDRLDDGSTAPTWGQPAWLVERAADLSRLAQAAPDAVSGDTACHGDLRADNVLVHRGRAVLVDWNWLAVAADWTDFVAVLPLARADGVDADAWVRRSPLCRDVAPDAVDAWLANIAAYMLAAADDPVWAGGSPLVRVHQRRYARTFLDWIAARRGWS